MEKRVLFSFLLVATCVAGLPVEKEKGLLEETFADIFNVTEYGLLSKLEILDDDDNLIDVNLEDDGESEPLTDENIAKRVLFLLYTSNKNPVEIKVNDEKGLKASNFDPKKPTYFVTHGWMNSRRSSACTLVRDAYLKHGDYNVIVIDWSDISFRPYMWATNQVKRIALYLAELLNMLQKNGADLSKMVLAGHSLGAHIVGLGARNCKGKVGYVVGLDPALPNFYLSRAGSRISNTDANYVEIIHTNAGLLGWLSAIGDIDHYPNGGFKQPGCFMMDVGGACSHARSYRLFAESINSQGFIATKCDSYSNYKANKCGRRPATALMGGIKKVFSDKGTFYLSTQSKSPFAMGK